MTLEILCTDENVRTDIVRYIASNKHRYTALEIIELMHQGTKFEMHMDGRKVRLETQHFDNTVEDDENKKIRLFLLNLPKCLPNQYT